MFLVEEREAFGTLLKHSAEHSRKTQLLHFLLCLLLSIFPLCNHLDNVPIKEGW